MAIDPFLGTLPQRGFIATSKFFLFSISCTYELWVCVALIQAIAVLTLVAIVFGKVQAEVDTREGTYKTLPCYFSLFALAEIFVLVITIDALKLRNIIQLVGILAFQVAMMIFSALQIRQTKTALVKNPGGACFTNCDGPGSLWAEVEPLLIAVPCILGASWLPLVWFTRKLFYEFGWAVFHAVGASPTLKKMYQYYQVMICLLKFDFFAFLLILVINPNSPEFAVTIAAIPIVLILLITCGIALKREIKSLMTVSLILMAAALSYFIFKFVRYYSPQTADQYQSTRVTLSVFTVVAFLLVFASFAIGLRCFADFDKGLRQPKINDPSAPSRSKLGSSPGMGERTGSSYISGQPLAPRMSIE
ncbi:hypothetical protein BU17DRAFT_101944 [Hysterangium stoloniferum]|nr:hypothetical protein BU17DRAFT_101944 [Hysterangium stoloniferum]